MVRVVRRTTATALLSALLIGASAVLHWGTTPTTAQQIVYERIPDEIVSREVAPKTIAVKEIVQQEVVKEVAPPESVQKDEPAQTTAPARKPPVRAVAATARPVTVKIPQDDLNLFLDRLMHAESSGRDDAANPRSSAIGPFQFIKSTFIDIARRHFPRVVSELSDEELLELRTHRNFARAAAAAYTRENAAQLKAQGAEPSLPNLRLAFLLGASAAARVLQAPPKQSLAEVLEPAVLKANPFMVGMSAVGLIAKAGRDILGRSHVVDSDGTDAVVRPSARARPGARHRPGTTVVKRAAPEVVVNVKCNQKLASCQRWIALQVQKRLKQRKLRDAQGTGGRSRKVDASS